LDQSLISRDPTPTNAMAVADQARGRLSMAFLRDLITAGMGDLTSREALLVMAINQANIARLTRERDARVRYGGLLSPAPDAERRPVSISSVAHSLGLPFETVRRNVRALSARGVCAVTEAGVIVPQAFLVSPGYLDTVRIGNERLFALYGALIEAGLMAPLPDPSFPPEAEPPMRGAARLLSDYVLRTTEHLIGEAGDLIPCLILAAVLGERGRGVTVAALARSLRMPTETVRRHAAGLIRRERLQRTGHGLTITEEMRAEPPWTGFWRINAANLQRLFAGLAERGVVEAWRRASPGAAQPGWR
jgi:hypothetical protein